VYIHPIDSPDSADAIGSVDFHPLQPYLLSVSGSRHFPAVEESADTDSEEDGRGDDGETKPAKAMRQRRKLQPLPSDKTISLWDWT
jgi:WD40 repeat protein